MLYPNETYLILNTPNTSSPYTFQPNSVSFHPQYQQLLIQAESLKR
jgi:hypothetical protein